LSDIRPRGYASRSIDPTFANREKTPGVADFDPWVAGTGVSWVSGGGVFINFAGGSTRYSLAYRVLYPPVNVSHHYSAEMIYFS
jgi:hypothetical protein